MHVWLTRQVLWNRTSDRLIPHRLRRWRRQARFLGLELFELELQLRDLCIELFGGAAEVHALQLLDLQLELVDLDLSGHK